MRILAQLLLAWPIHDSAGYALVHTLCPCVSHMDPVSTQMLSLSPLTLQRPCGCLGAPGSSRMITEVFLSSSRLSPTNRDPSSWFWRWPCRVQVGPGVTAPPQYRLARAPHSLLPEQQGSPCLCLQSSPRPAPFKLPAEEGSSLATN